MVSRIVKTIINLALQQRKSQVKYNYHTTTGESWVSYNYQNDSCMSETFAVRLISSCKQHSLKMEMFWNSYPKGFDCIPKTWQAVRIAQVPLPIIDSFHDLPPKHVSTSLE